MTKEALERAIDIVGGQTALANVLREINPKIRQGHIFKWLNKQKGVPAEYVRAIEKATGCQVTRYELRPDVFGDQQESRSVA